MQYYRCKCGASEQWDSGEGPARCRPCRKCGSLVARGPDGHLEPLPHEFVEHMVETDDGPRPLSRCRYCHRTRLQIAQADAKAGQ